MNRQELLSPIYDFIHQNGWVGRLGKTFKTENNYYFYDMGTGKVAIVTYPVYIMLEKMLENCSLQDLANLDLTDIDFKNAVKDIDESIHSEYILSATPMEKITGDAVTMLDKILGKQVESVTLEVTEKCNLKCKYCIYNSSHSDFRDFGQKNMSFEVAKKAIDFLASHSTDVEDKYIGFYGGEPLLNFSVIHDTVEYAKEKIENIGFAMTTNATLMTKNIADFLMDNDFSVVISLDGPEEIHNENRVFPDGNGSYSKTVAGLMLLLNSAAKRNKNSNISLNIVTSGSNFIDRYNKIQDFIINSEFIPKGIGITTSSADYGPYDSPYLLPQSKEEKEILIDTVDKLDKWEKEYKDNHTKEIQLFSSAEDDKDLMLIHKRLLSFKPVEYYSINGCCVPGGRRIYVSTEGNFKICEKVGNIPEIGDVDNGFYKDVIEKIYIDDFIKEIKKYCCNCWAANLCSLCYVGACDKNGVHFEYRHDLCRGHRIYLENCLIKYHSVMESDPQRLNTYNHRDFK